MKKLLPLSVTAVIIFLAGCQKDSNSPANINRAMQTDNALSGKMVVTPFGLMDASRVHFIAKGYSLNMISGHLKKVEISSGKEVEDFGKVDKLDDNLNTGKKALYSSLYPAAASGWIAYTYWANTDTIAHPVTYFTTNWAVPTTPKKQGNQTLFLFNGMQDGLTASSYIIQPVLQWGSSAAGGGKYWAITNWYVSGSSAYYGTLEQVTSGTVLQGIMQQTAQSGKTYSYNSSFTGYPSVSNLQVNNVPQAWWCAETLETYSVTNVNTQYPPDEYVAMNAIQMLEGSTNAPINWTTAKANNNVPQKAVVVSNGSPNGQVNIYFRN